MEREQGAADIAQAMSTKRRTTGTSVFGTVCKKAMSAASRNTVPSAMALGSTLENACCMVSQFCCTTVIVDAKIIPIWTSSQPIAAA